MNGVEERPQDAHEADECLLCAPAGHENCEKYTVLRMLDPSRVPLGEADEDHLVDVPVCYEHFEAFQGYQRGESVREVSR